jgi:signal transduction histidine kinase
MSIERSDEGLEALRQRYRDLVARLEANDAEFRRLARSVMRVQEDERRRIARELHDGVGQNLAALKHQLALLQPEAPANGQDRIAACIALCAQTLEDTRQLSRLLRPQVLDDLGLVAALQWLGRTLDAKEGLRIEMQLDEAPELDPESQTVLFRIAQEALANVGRHAGATHALVRLGRRADLAMLTVWDDGHGFDVAAAAQRARHGEAGGLAGMHERLRLHGGQLQVESGADGTLLRATLPIGLDGAGA